MTVLILESLLASYVLHDQRVQHGCLLKFRYLFPQQDIFVLSILLILKEKEHLKGIFSLSHTV